MAYKQKNLFKIAQMGPTNSLWFYLDEDADGAAAVDTAGYFAGVDALAMLRIGDLIIRSTPSGMAKGKPTGITTMGFHIVNANSGTQIDVADALAITVADTD
jgi:hypothetical protein